MGSGKDAWSAELASTLHEHEVSEVQLRAPAETGSVSRALVAQPAELGALTAIDRLQTDPPPDSTPLSQVAVGFELGEAVEPLDPVEQHFWSQQPVYSMSSMLAPAPLSARAQRPLPRNTAGARKLALYAVCGVALLVGIELWVLTRGEAAPALERPASTSSTK
ncbi:MAG TPA: hypothetical protein VER33_04910 [Polyangiaceae bacterium]|nr:hypothetical protein [Polyangiaceae bacterium]